MRIMAQGMVARQRPFYKDLAIALPYRVIGSLLQ